MEASQKRSNPLKNGSYKAYRLFLSTTLLLLLAPSVYSMEKPDSMIVVPVADVSGVHPSFLKNLDPEYESKRIHQELLHSLVRSVKTSGPYTFIEIPGIRVGSDGSNRFWTLSSNIKNLESIPNNYLIPSETYKNSNTSPTIALIYPYNDKKNKRIISAGTRFVIKKKQKKEYVVSAFNTDKNEWDTITIPRRLCTPLNFKTTPHEKRKQFVSLLRSWSHQKKGFIPYVLGGCSFCTIDPDPYKNRTDKNIKHQTGIDCSGLVWLVAHKICNMPYYFKNTTALEAGGTPLQPNEPLQEGDLVWIPGHVLIIADIYNNTIIEARGYPHEYGRVHELPIKKVFKDINTLADLRTAIENNIPLVRLDKKGQTRDMFTRAKIIKLC